MANTRSESSGAAAPELELRPATRERWGDLAELFERPGPRGGQQVSAKCWCLFWRVDPQTFRKGWNNRGAGNKAGLKAIVDEGRVPGLLAYDASGTPVGWVSVAPRSEFPRIERSTSLVFPDERADVWAIACFYIPRSHRKQGVGAALLEGAVRYAAEQGARVVEGYGCRPDDEDPFTGLNSMFEAAGFTKEGEGRRRTTWRKYVVAASP